MTGNKRSWSCRRCGEVYFNKWKWRKHLKRHYYDDLASKCKACGELFTNKPELEAHEQLCFAVEEGRVSIAL